MATHVRHMMHIMLYIQCYPGLRRHKANAAQQSIAHGLLTRFRLPCVDNLGRSGLAAAGLAAAPPRWLGSRLHTPGYSPGGRWHRCSTAAAALLPRCRPPWTRADDVRCAAARLLGHAAARRRLPLSALPSCNERSWWA